MQIFDGSLLCCQTATSQKREIDIMKTDILIAGTGCSGLYCALQLPADMRITIITKSDAEDSDSFLAQGGICMLRDASDYDSYFEDTLRAGHYENDTGSVEIMLRSSQRVIRDLLDYGVKFQQDENGHLAFTKEGAHSRHRILFHKDITGREITEKLLARVRRLPNVTLLAHTTLLDVISRNNTCLGAVIRQADGSLDTVRSLHTILACGGIGGLYLHSTNFRHLTGDAIAIAKKHGIALKNTSYVQIHPTTLYSPRDKDRSFLISESVRGEGALLYDRHMQRFVNELLPRDQLTTAILTQMEKDHTDYVWEDLRTIPPEELSRHFPNIVAYCASMGYDVTKECIPVVPAQHYYMGGIQTDYNSRTSMSRLYAIGETACNGVHGRNRLASNSLLESLVFAARAAGDITCTGKLPYSPEPLPPVSLDPYRNGKALAEEYQHIVQHEIAGTDHHSHCFRPVVS